MMRRLIFPIYLLAIVSCKDKEYLRIEVEKESGSMVSMRNFSRSSYKESGELEWKLKGDESYIFPKENKTIVYGFEFKQLEKGNVTSAMTGDRGEINHSTKTVVLSGKVKLKTNDGKYIESESLTYNLDDKTLSSEDDVLVYSDGTTIRGKGLRADKSLNKFTIIQPKAVTVGGSNPLKDK
ncbi:LPS export ABC transporter periplasmic protein LptC [Leptospira kanakyensis]|uniref:LPS export ABC transporter periplasmic protein LptC n=1 Tax=Leptospira kanakyensis TaxID=2484968 RepID=A0A6N4QAX8_9LEPT|nr:LPS export ABC transporter periplasmic protein LptC [Leptospira kanakyensis]MCW7470682.1 LPS export ABC transporter periplasmic protein LptC [Leptospira kanakyensis]TGK53727.1 LPS export ABC transporter periplasmic protein LptC [Leptospira kanakyensis]TGK57522.1 LPS export ABC transporter periplasmic protein LptC [Leptospira kanakyensis]TGK73232.1 LPS export ABC transporter periplasmic protein LptC [Leptospira kanakyensis]